MEANTGYKIFLESAEIHCKSNTILGSKLLYYIQENKLIPTNDILEADFVLINTCGFDERHELISEQIINELSKSSRKETKIITIGCLNRTNRKFLEDRFSNIHIINKEEELDAILNAKKSISDINRQFLDPSAFQYITNRRDNMTSLNRFGAFLALYLLKFSNIMKYPFGERIKLKQVMDECFHSNKFYVQIGSGCFGNCSYCVIKRAKGSPKSRKIEDILDDIENGFIKKHSDISKLVVNLVADDCASYGADSNMDLVTLLEAIKNKYPSVLIDICYINPMWIEQNESLFLSIFSRFSINSVNISMQSGSDRVITLMNRQYSIDKIIPALKKIRQISPNTMIWSHFMVGFPTESWADFFKTVRVLHCFHFFAMFRYTRHDGTKSAEIETGVSPLVSFLRNKILFWYLVLRGIRKLFFYF